MKKLLIIILLLFAGCFSDSLPLNTKQTRAEITTIPIPKVSKPSGTYIDSVFVYGVIPIKMSAYLRYTLDGTEPTKYGSKSMGAGITIKESCTLKLKAFDTNGLSDICSPTLSVKYTIIPSFKPEAFIYNSVLYKGRNDMGSGSSIVNDYSNYLTLTEPKMYKFNCEGFFTIKGAYNGIDVGRYMILRITKLDSGKYDKYFIEGKDFNKRIWLRYGKGEYEVKLNPAPILNYTNYNADPEYVTSTATMFLINKWVITNTRDEDGRFYYPSYNVQSDDEYIKNKANEILAQAGTTNGTTWWKCFTLMKYVVDNLQYDDYAMLGVNCRQSQDAINCLKSGFAVCDGYSNVYASLCRSVGIKCKSVRSENHAWNEVLMPDGKWLMVDCLWNDTGVTGWYSMAYFLTVEFDEKHIKTDDRENR